MSVIANRMFSFAISNDLLSSSQKWLAPQRDVTSIHRFYNHLFLTGSANNKNLFVAWLDLRNAFGSAPHEIISLISLSLSHMGVSKQLFDLITNVYTGAFTEVRTPSGSTPTIPILAGVKQGCPLSPIIFNLCIEIIIRSINAKGIACGPTLHYGAKISTLAYADDLC